MGTIYDENGGKYEVNDNYLLPCLTIGSTGKNEIGMWGQRHKRYLKSHHRVFYYNLLTLVSSIGYIFLIFFIKLKSKFYTIYLKPSKKFFESLINT